MPILSVRCGDEDHARLKAAAAALGVSMSEFVRCAAREAALDVLKETIRRGEARLSPPPSEEPPMDQQQQAAWLRRVVGWEE